MKHFHYYPKIEYSNQSAVNIMVRGKIRNAILTNSALYYKYTLNDGDRPDILATKYYGNPNYTWALFYANNMFHPTLDWPLPSSLIVDALTLKYGNLNELYRKIHHYEYTDTGTKITYIIDKTTYDLWKSDKTTVRDVREVTNFEHEFRLNEAKRNIVVLDSDYLQQITNELKNLFK